MKLNRVSLCIIALAFAFCWSAFAGNYSSWQKFRRYPMLEFSVQKGDFNSYANKYEWHVKFRNLSAQTIYFDYALNEQGVAAGGDFGRTHLMPYQQADSYVGNGGGWKLLYSSEEIEVVVSRIRLGDDDSGPYMNPSGY